MDNSTKQFIIKVAADYGFTLTNDEIERCYEIIVKQEGVDETSGDFYYRLKEYFLN